MEAFALSLSVLVNLAFIGFGIYYKEGIRAFIDFRKQKELRRFEKELTEKYDRKYKAEKVAELFALKFNAAATRENCFKLEKLIWELALWLPKERVCKISEVMVGVQNKDAALELLIDIRKDLGIDDGLEAENITYLGASAEPTKKEEENG